MIGALLNRAEQTISYFKNGIDLGTAFTEVSEEKLYPCVGMQTHEEEVTLNDLAGSKVIFDILQTINVLYIPTALSKFCLIC